MVGIGVARQGVVSGFGLLALAFAVGLLFGFRRPGVGGRTAVAGDVEQPAGKGDWGIRDRRAFAALVAIVCLDTLVQSGFLTFVAFLMLEKQVPTGLATFAVVLTLAGGIFGKFGCGFLTERVGVIHSLIVFECLTAVGIMVILLSPTLTAFAFLPVLGIVLQGLSSITYGTMSDLVRGERRSRRRYCSRASSFLQCVAYTGRRSR